MFHILVVEDDAKLRSLFCTVLTNNGYLALPAESGEKALSLLDSEYVDLIISDIMMPGMDGYELIDHLRTSGFTVSYTHLPYFQLFFRKMPKIFQGFQCLHILLLHLYVPPVFVSALFHGSVNGRTLSAVSYTHLDVYKRQAPRGSRPA